MSVMVTVRMPERLLIALDEFANASGWKRGETLIYAVEEFVPLPKDYESRIDADPTPKAKEPSVRVSKAKPKSENEPVAIPKIEPKTESCDICRHPLRMYDGKLECLNPQCGNYVVLRRGR